MNAPALAVIVAVPTVSLLSTVAVNAVGLLGPKKTFEAKALGGIPMSQLPTVLQLVPGPPPVQV